MNFHEERKDFYIGYLKRGNKCIVRRNNKATYLICHVELGKKSYTSIDEGFDVKTHKKVWGSEHGSLEFERILEHDLDINNSKV